MGELDVDSIDGVKKLTFNGNEYVFWHKAKVVLPYVHNFLKQKFPDDYILSEFNRIDFAVLGKNLPVEVQSTLVQKNNLHYSSFEEAIQKQIVQNVNVYGKCWVFFDSEFLKYLKNESIITTKLKFDWFLQYVKEDKLQVFGINYEGKIKHLSYDDLSFLKIFFNSDFEINKSKILFHTFHGCGYKSEEIYEYRNIYKLSQDKIGFFRWSIKKEQPERIKKLAYILNTMKQLKKINNFLLRKTVDSHVKNHLQYIGILNHKDSYWSLEDRFNILQFFPSYIENKEFWDEMKGERYNFKEFSKLILDKK